jgi:pyruvate kinase
MTSGETAIGHYPIETIMMIQRIAHEVEPAVEPQVQASQFINISETVSHSIQRIANSMPLDKIVTLTRSGYTARMIARLKPTQDILAVTPNKRVRSQLQIAYGVKPVYYDYLDAEERISNVARYLYAKGLISDDETVLFTAASHTAAQHHSNVIEIHNIAEFVKYMDPVN